MVDPQLPGEGDRQLDAILALLRASCLRTRASDGPGGSPRMTAGAGSMPVPDRCRMPGAGSRLGFDLDSMPSRAEMPGRVRCLACLLPCHPMPETVPVRCRRAAACVAELSRS